MNAVVKLEVPADSVASALADVARRLSVAEPHYIGVYRLALNDAQTFVGMAQDFINEDRDTATALKLVDDALASLATLVDEDATGCAAAAAVMETTCERLAAAADTLRKQNGEEEGE